MPRPQKDKGGLIKYLLAVVVLALFLGTTAFAAYTLGYKAGIANPRTVVVEELTNIEQPPDSEPKIDFSIFWEVWDQLREKHPGFEDIDKQTLVYGAVKGLTNALGDPNTVFFTPSESKRFGEDISGSFSGIGIEISIRDDQLVVVAPLAKSPAEKAGLQAGDIILAIDGDSTKGITIDEAVDKIRGVKGSTVELTIRRAEESEVRTFPIVRQEIQVPSVEARKLEDGILYLRIHNFSANTPLMFYTELLKNAFDPTRGVVLDLRNNPGGFLDIGIEATGWFIGNDKLVVTEQFSSGEENPFYSRGSGPLKELPLVILVNEGSASAAEIMAGAIRHHRGTKLIGTPTFGKGTVQQFDQLSDSSSIKVTVANWLLPNGDLIEGAGLQPDITVEQPEDDIINGSDTQLQKAVEVLKSQM